MIFVSFYNKLKKKKHPNISDKNHFYQSKFSHFASNPTYSRFNTTDV